MGANRSCTRTTQARSSSALRPALLPGNLPRHALPHGHRQIPRPWRQCLEFSQTQRAHSSSSRSGSSARPECRFSGDTRALDRSAKVADGPPATEPSPEFFGDSGLRLASGCGHGKFGDLGPEARAPRAAYRLADPSGSTPIAAAALPKGEGQAGPQARRRKDSRTLPAMQRCRSLIAPLLSRWRVESVAARRLGLPVCCVDGSTGSKRLSAIGSRATHRGRKRQDFLATLPCERCFSVAVLSSIIRRPRRTGRRPERIELEARHPGSSTRTREVTLALAQPGVASTKLRASSPLTGTGTARLQHARKRAAHLKTALLGRMWKGTPTPYDPRAGGKGTHPGVYQSRCRQF